MDSAYKLKKEYSASGVPTVIADGELNILWKNNTDGSVLETAESADFIFDGGIPVTGLIIREISGVVFTFNVIKTDDVGDGRSYYIIELIASCGIGGFVSAESVRDYISYICSKIKTAANDITSVTDGLFDDISAGTFSAGRAAEGFEQIYESVIGLEREAVYPERIYSLADPRKPDDVIILDREMTTVVSVIKSTLSSGPGSRIRISEDYDRDIFFRMNTDSFETALVSMAAECCADGFYPERIIFSTRRSGRDRAEITVMSLAFGSAVRIKDRSEKSINGESGPFPFGAEMSFNRKLLAEYVYDVLGLKNGARFSKENIPGGFVYRMNIEVFTKGASVFAEKPVDGSDRRQEILEKLVFFFGGSPQTEMRRYTYRNVPDGHRENESGSEWDCNIYREDIENEKSEI